jgi:hypothetical protein
MPRHDPIGERYYRPLRRAETASEVLFYSGALLSIATLLVSKIETPIIYDVTQISFVLVVAVNFMLGCVARLYLGPRAEDKRRQDLLSNSYNANLTHENAVGYFNNDQTNHIKRLAASVMESSFFTSNVIREMLMCERIKVIGYGCIWIVAVLARATDLGLIAVAAQVLFSEQILMKWLRMEWLRMRSEMVYADIHRLFTTVSSFNKAASHARVIEYYGAYETGKAYASVVLSDRIFQKRNPALSSEWDEIRRGLNL